MIKNGIKRIDKGMTTSSEITPVNLHIIVCMTGDCINEPSNLRKQLHIFVRKAPCVVINDTMNSSERVVVYHISAAPVCHIIRKFLTLSFFSERTYLNGETECLSDVCHRLFAGHGILRACGNPLPAGLRRVCLSDYGD